MELITLQSRTSLNNSRDYFPISFRHLRKLPAGTGGCSKTNKQTKNRENSWKAKVFSLLHHSDITEGNQTMSCHRAEITPRTVSDAPVRKAPSAILIWKVWGREHNPGKEPKVLVT